MDAQDDLRRITHGSCYFTVCIARDDFLALVLFAAPSARAESCAVLPILHSRHRPHPQPKVPATQCKNANWWHSFDKKGWSECPAGYLMTGFYKNTCVLFPPSFSLLPLSLFFSGCLFALC